MNLTQPTIALGRLVIGANPRTYFDPAAAAELAASVRASGILEPILVRPKAGTEQYEIIAGERRYRAAKEVFDDSYQMPVVVRDVSDDEAESLAIIENVQRADMSIADEARAAGRLLHRNSNDKDETALQLGWPRARLDRRLTLLSCSDAVLTALAENKILVGHAELLAGVPAPTQDKVLAGLIERRVGVDVLKQQLGQFARRLDAAIFDTASCATCVHNSARQSSMFETSLGDGYCQNPVHFDELTMAEVERRAAALRDRFPRVQIVKVEDGFIPLPVRADGELGVGEAQLSACRSCAQFGCAVSAMPGRYGEVTEELCFDSPCNTAKIAAQRQAQREANKAAAAAAATPARSTAKAKVGASDKAATSTAPKPSNQVSGRFVEYRTAAWRKWTANAAMKDHERNPLLLIALVSCSNTRSIDSSQFRTAAEKILGVSFGFDMAGNLAQLATAPQEKIGIEAGELPLWMNYLQVDEAKNFTLDATFLALFTVSELEGIAEETGLKAAMGNKYKTARAGKKDDFMKALLAVPDFPYAGTVPASMRYKRT
jgi:PRTRC genetic system ParB family protein